MAGIAMVGSGNFRIRDYNAAIRERDPKKCWIFQSLIDYDDFQRLQERTREQITASKVTKRRKRKEIESKNSAGNSKNRNSNLTFDVEEYSDDDTLGEFLRKQRSLKVKKKQKALEAEEQRLVVTEPPPVGSCGRLTGLNSLGSASRVYEPMVGVGGAKKKQKTLEVEGVRLSVTKRLAGGSRGRLGGLKSRGSASRVNEPVVGVGGAKKKKVGREKAACSVSMVHEPSRVLEPVAGVGGAKNKQKAVNVEEPRLFVANSSPTGSYVRLGGLKPLGSVSRVHEPVMGVGGAKNKQKVSDIEEPRLLMANGLNPWELEVLGCAINKNPAELCSQTAKKFMRRIMS